MAESQKKPGPKPDSKFKSADGTTVKVDYEQHHSVDSRFNVLVGGQTVGHIVEGEDTVTAFVHPAAIGRGFGAVQEVGSGKDRKEAVQALVDVVAPHLGE